MIIHLDVRLANFWVIESIIIWELENKKMAGGPGWAPTALLRITGVIDSVH
ncbi:MAG: hypothetical protein CM15mP48_2640 [Candidatus Poseidoniales archaeon]|nr:MAG: hypothetical protein CM15mP48_2640 [Candidatus Poseidoniales archaeon]